MIANASERSVQISTVVDEVLPRLGLAYVSDDQGHTWGLTRQAQGLGLDLLQPGQRLTVTLTQFDDFTIASAYAPLCD